MNNNFKYAVNGLIKCGKVKRHIKNYGIIMTTFKSSHFLMKSIPQKRGEAEVEHQESLCLCFGHYDDDYKVIFINRLQNVYHVYIYSLSIDS